MRTILFVTASAFLATAALAQTTGTPGSSATTPPPASGAMTPAPADAGPSTMAPGTATDTPGATAPMAADDGMTQTNGKWMKDGRKATKTEIAEHKKSMKPM